jgi:nucleoside-diphosphate-sugar epimerase
MANFLILGSSGQIGAYLAEYLRNVGHRVSEFDLVNDPKQDLRVPENSLLDELVSKCDFVYFLAFDVGGSHYLEKYQNAKEFIDNNLRIMYNTFNLLDKYTKPFVFASSQMSNMSQSTYGLLKAVGERYATALNGIIVKFWNVYGYESDPNKFHVISDFIDMARRDRIIKMRTTGVEKRDFLFAEDCCRGLFEIYSNYGKLREHVEIHLASFKWTTILEVAQCVADIFEAEIVPGNKQDSVQNNIQNVPDEFFLNYWKPTNSIGDGIRKIVSHTDLNWS